MSWTDLEKKNTSTTQEKPEYTKFNIGQTRIRVLDTEPYSFWQHWIPTANTSAVCPGKGEGCPICEIIAKQKANPDLPKQYSSSQRHAMNVWNYDTGRQEIMIQGNTFFQQLLVLFKENGDLTEYDLKVVRSGDGKNTTYTVIPQMPSKFENMDKIVYVNLSEVIKPTSKDDMMMLMSGKSWKEINEIRKAESGFSEVSEDICF